MLKPHHEHPLLRDYSEWQPLGGYYFASWFCPICLTAIVGPPFEIGEYIVTTRYYAGPNPRRRWIVTMKTNREPLFEHPHKREALEHARALEKERIKILKSLARA